MSQKYHQQYGLPIKYFVFPSVNTNRYGEQLKYLTFKIAGFILI